MPNPPSSPLAPPGQAPLGYRRLEEAWDVASRQHAAAIAALADRKDLGPLRALQSSARELFNRSPDGSLYHLIYLAGHDHSQYSSRHALLASIVCRLSAALLDWPESRIASVELAALTMNAAMAKLQDRLATDERKPSAAEKLSIDAHGAEAALLLRGAGLQDDACIDAVLRHHEPPPPRQTAEAGAAGAELVTLLRTVDVFTAKLSRRGRRIPVSPLWAARETCLLTDAGPDRTGAAMIKALGLYPPGTYVRLVTDEIGIVYRRGVRANNALVAVMLDKFGVPSTKALFRDTSDAKFAVRATVPIGTLRHRPPNERIFPEG